jgi:hypothetical protein
VTIGLCATVDGHILSALASMHLTIAACFPISCMMTPYLLRFGTFLLCKD